MPNFTDLTGLAGVAVAATAATLLLPSVARLAQQRMAVLLGLIFVLMLVPLGNLSLAAYLRGATGDLSITTLVLLACALLKFRCNTSDSKHYIQLLVTLVALVLYPMALGASSYDPYRLGYGDTQFVAALLLLALVAWVWKHDLIAVCIASATLAWSIGWYESGNLWDYLLDPFVSIYALSAIISRMVKTLSMRAQPKKSQPTFPE